MPKIPPKNHRRAYVNPLLGFGEAAQRTAIERFCIIDGLSVIDEWYVESRNVTRADFIKHLRPGDQAIVARAACFAKATGRNDDRLADLAEARGDVHARGAVLVSADDGLDSRNQWPAMKAVAKTSLVAFKNMANGSTRKYNYTDGEIEKMLRIRRDKTLANDEARRAAIVRAKIEPPGRTWLIQTLPIVASERGIEI